MNRDRRLTGNIRGQIDAARAPAGFEVNNPWKVRIQKYDNSVMPVAAILTMFTGREAHLLDVRSYGMDA